MQIFLLLMAAYSNLHLFCTEKRAITQVTKWQWHWSWKARLSTTSFKFAPFLIWCQFAISNLWMTSMLCEDCHTNVWWHIDFGQDKFEFEFPASCLFNIVDVAWIIVFEICILFLQQKGSNIRIVFGPIIFILHSFLKYNIEGKWHTKWYHSSYTFSPGLDNVLDGDNLYCPHRKNVC